MNEALQEAEAVLAAADCLHDAAQVQEAYDRLADAISREYTGRNPLVLCVMTGGFVPAAEVTRRLSFGLEVDYLHATRYRGATQGGGLVWKRQPEARRIEGRHVLVIDDILDEGHTLVAIRKALMDFSPASLRIAVLAEKIHDRRAAGAHAEFIGLKVEDRYVFGCGMDYKEYWRQLPAIYAVKGMSRIAVIGGTGMNEWPGLTIQRVQPVATPYGEPSAPLTYGRIYGADVIFLPRHGDGHKVPPHLINYRANLWALKDAGVTSVIAISAVGGIARSMPPAAVAVPDDLVDYTWGREHTYFDGVRAPLKHIEFTEPYTARLRDALLAGARRAGVKLVKGGVMGVTQGPRLETPAEIARMKRDGCTMVGMTGMPEAALAREVELGYACLALSVNWAAGIGRGDIHGEIERCIAEGMRKVRAVLAKALPGL